VAEILATEWRATLTSTSHKAAGEACGSVAGVPAAFALIGRVASFAASVRHRSALSQRPASCLLLIEAQLGPRRYTAAAIDSIALQDQDSGMHKYVIDHPHNEASALILIHNQALLDAHDWDVAFWIVSDEEPAQKAIAALGHRRSDHEAEDGQSPGWEVRRLKCKLTKNSTDDPTEDCEALARAGSWIYVFGSHYGSKDGPLDPERHFVARFNEALVRIKGDHLKTELDVARPEFQLHRLVNDALRTRGIELIDRGPEAQEQFIGRTRTDVAAGRPDWKELVQPGDRPINVEGATFLPSGRLLLGLRYPVTADGHPIMVEIDGIDRFFSHKDRGAPVVTRVLVLANVGTQKVPHGVRELDQRGSTIHVITGDLESSPDKSVLLKDHPQGEQARSEHHTFQIPADPKVVNVEGEVVRRFSEQANVEGLTVDDDGSVWYAHDDEQIRLHLAPGEHPRHEPDEAAAG
jgi:hypothetical protein